MGNLITYPDIVVPQILPGEILKNPIYSGGGTGGFCPTKAFGNAPLWKVDEKTHSVYGLSTAEVADCDNEVANYADSKTEYNLWGDRTAAITSAAGQAVSRGNIRYQHTSQIAGKVLRIDCLDDKRQIWLLTEPVDDKMWEQLAGGFLTGYSHAGRYKYRRCYICAYDLPAGNYCPQCRKDVTAEYAPVLTEVSYVDRPCLGIATFAYVKLDGTTEMRKFVAPAAKKVLVDIRELATLFTANFQKAIEDLGKKASEPKCPHCGSTDYGLKPPDFETAHCHSCDKNWNHGIVAGVNDPREKLDGRQVSIKVDDFDLPFVGKVISDYIGVLRDTGASAGRRLDVEVLDHPYSFKGESGKYKWNGMFRGVKAEVSEGPACVLELLPATKSEVAKRARTPVGRFTNNASGPEHDSLMSAGYEHTRTGNWSDGHSDHQTTARTYAHESGASLTLCEDGRWAHADGKGRTTTGAGVEALSSHLAASHKKKVEDTNTMEDAAVQKFIKEQVAAAVAAGASTINIKLVDGVVKFFDASGAEIQTADNLARYVAKSGDEEDVTCPFCGEEFEADSDDEDTAECPNCNREVPIKAAKVAKNKVVKLAKKLSAAIDDCVAAVSKDMSQIGRLADILQGIRWLQQSSFWEGEIERDERDFAIAEELGEWLNRGVLILGRIVDDETSELTEDIAVPALKAAIHNQQGDDMNATELLNKAAKGLKGHFGKAAGFHEKMAEHHMGEKADHEKMAEAHKAAGEGEGADKAFHKAGHNHHMGKAAFHEKVHKAHTGMCEACKAAGESMGSEEAKADSNTDLTKAMETNKADLDAKLEVITKGMAALDSISKLGEELATLKSDFTKFSNETLPTLVKGPGSPALIDPSGRTLDTSQTQNEPGATLPSVQKMFD
jgi:hypothetical protein